MGWGVSPGPVVKQQIRQGWHGAARARAEGAYILTRPPPPPLHLPCPPRPGRGVPPLPAMHSLHVCCTASHPTTLPRTHLLRHVGQQAGLPRHLVVFAQHGWRQGRDGHRGVHAVAAPHLIHLCLNPINYEVTEAPEGWGWCRRASQVS